MKVIALIPLRGGSKSIPYKNIKPIAGKPLCYWVCKAAVSSDVVDEVYVSTDDKKIKDTVGSLNLGITVIDRPAEYAGDKATTDSVMLHFASIVSDFDLLYTIQATSPLTTSIELGDAFTQFQAQKLDSMLTGVRVKRFFWSDDGKALNYDYLHRPMRQDFKGTLMENGAFYITKKDILLKEKNRLGGVIGVYEMSDSAAVELDEPSDWSVVESLLLERS